MGSRVRGRGGSFAALSPTESARSTWLPPHPAHYACPYRPPPSAWPCTPGQGLRDLGPRLLDPVTLNPISRQNLPCLFPEPETAQPSSKGPVFVFRFPDPFPSFSSTSPRGTDCLWGAGAEPPPACEPLPAAAAASHSSQPLLCRGMTLLSPEWSPSLGPCRQERASLCGRFCSPLRLEGDESRRLCLGLLFSLPTLGFGAGPGNLSLAP